MPDYDFHQLSPYDLEILTRDLLQAHWGVTLESFKTGRDGGVDLRYAPSPGEIVVQVKHYLRTGFNGLLRALKAEASKVRRLNPRRYVLSTSVSLSRANKNKIVGVIGADKLNPEDILGAEDLNNLLGQYPEIEMRHFKLWIASRAVLDRVLNNALITSSDFKARQVYEQAKRYVMSGAYPKAFEMLNAERVVIIAGPPGVGKTTLANLLLYMHLEQGYQAILINRDVSEAGPALDTGVKRIFYFDDFMGATFSGDRSSTGAGANDRALLHFIAMVRASPKSRLILTTREHVYMQAIDRSERLREADLDELRVVLDLPSYDRMQRAKILYNHIYFSNLPVPYRDELLREDFYLKIIKHEKFNPRLIEWLSNHKRLKKVPAKSYQSFIEGLLDDPSEIWRHAYEQEITEAGRSMLLALRSLGGSANGRDLQQAFSKLHKARAGHYQFQMRPEDFRSGLHEVENSFIKPYENDGFEVVDPSVLDLMNTVLRTVPDNIADIFAGAFSFLQVERIWSFAKMPEHKGVITRLKHRVADFSANIGRLAIEDRYVDQGAGVAVRSGPSYERRLTIVVEMAEWLSSSELAALVQPTMNKLSESWRRHFAAIVDGVELFRTLDDVNVLPDNKVKEMRTEVQIEILESVRAGCSSEELRELISVMDSFDEALSVIDDARVGFDVFQRDEFKNELNKCYSSEDCDVLIEDLKIFGRVFEVDVGGMIVRVEEARAEFDENEAAYDDHMQDQWKEQRYFEREADRDLSEMFSSLRDGRS